MRTREKDLQGTKKKELNAFPQTVWLLEFTSLIMTRMARTKKRLH
jgi:hypothetical protein